MFELIKTDEINRLIAITKSDSGISGPKLAQAHTRLGTLLAESLPVDPNDTTVVAILRGGIFFAEGIYYKLGCQFQLFDPKNDSFVRPETKHVILADSVINTGNTIRQIYQDDMLIACCVINAKTVPILGNNLFTVRVSNNSFVGADIKTQIANKGPDTTMRLFNLL